MSTLSEVRDRVERVLQDEANLSWSVGEMDEAIRMALAEYSLAAPLEAETVITLPGEGREIALDGVEGLRGVSQVWWPYESGASAETWPPNQVQGWRVYWDEARPVLFLSRLRAGQPQAGEELRLWYTKNHTLQDLDGAAITTLAAESEGLLVQGAAGYAALFGSVDRGEVLDRGELRKWAEGRLRWFRLELERLRAAGTRHGGEPWGDGWRLDKWEESRG